MGNDFVNEVDPTGGCLTCLFGSSGYKVGSKVAQRSTMVTHTATASKLISQGASAMVTGTFTALSSIGTFIQGNDLAYDLFVEVADKSGQSGTLALINAGKYLYDGTNIRGEKANGTQVALDIAKEIPLGKVFKFAKVSKNLYAGVDMANDARQYVPKILNQFNSIESLIQSVTKFSKSKLGKIGQINGNAEGIFKGLAAKYGAKIIVNGKVANFVSDNFSVTLYPSTTTGLPTLQINIADKKLKIRISP